MVLWSALQYIKYSMHTTNQDECTSTQNHFTRGCCGLTRWVICASLSFNALILEHLSKNTPLLSSFIFSNKPSDKTKKKFKLAVNPGWCETYEGPWTPHSLSQSETRFQQEAGERLSLLSPPSTNTVKRPNNWQLIDNTTGADEKKNGQKFAR